MTESTNETLETHRKYKLDWYHAHKSPELNRARYAVFKKKLEDPEFREEFNRKRREKRRAAAEARRAAETDEEREAKKRRQREATIAANKARAKPKSATPPAKPKPQISLAHARELNKRKPGRIVALSGWKGW